MTDNIEVLEAQLQAMIHQAPQIPPLPVKQTPLPNMPNFYIWNNQNVSVHHHHHHKKQEDDETELLE